MCVLSCILHCHNLANVLTHSKWTKALSRGCLVEVLATSGAAPSKRGKSRNSRPEAPTTWVLPIQTGKKRHGNPKNGQDDCDVNRTCFKMIKKGTFSSHLQRFLGILPAKIAWFEGGLAAGENRIAIPRGAVDKDPVP